MAVSSAILTDLAAAKETRPSALSIANSYNPNGPIMDIPGMIDSLELTAKEMKNKANVILSALHADDPIRPAILNIRDTFV